MDGRFGVGEKMIATRARRNTVPKDAFTTTAYIGGGSYGEVHAGVFRDPARGGEEQEVAVKRIRCASVFEHEANVLSQLSHNNIVRYVADCSHETLCYLITELVQGGNLRFYLDECQDPLPTEQIHNMATQLASALNYLHNYDVPIIHRDVKSPNVLLVKHVDPAKFTIKLADVGIARTQAMEGTHMTQCKGSFPWSSPEVLDILPHNLRTYSTKADVYSFGVVVWEMLTRKVPYAGMSPNSVLFLRGRGQLHLDSPVAAPPHLHRLFQHCTQFNPRSRPTMAEVVRWLERALLDPSDGSSPLLTPVEEPQVEDTPAYTALCAHALGDQGVRECMVGLDAATRAVAEQLVRATVRAMLAAGGGVDLAAAAGVAGMLDELLPEEQPQGAVAAAPEAGTAEGPTAAGAEGVSEQAPPA